MTSSSASALVSESSNVSSSTSLSTNSSRSSPQPFKRNQSPKPPKKIDLKRRIKNRGKNLDRNRSISSGSFEKLKRGYKSKLRRGLEKRTNRRDKRAREDRVKVGKRSRGRFDSGRDSEERGNARYTKQRDRRGHIRKGRDR